MRNRLIFLIIFMITSLSILFGQNLNETQILSALDADDNEESGMAVAISGDFAVVGAWLSLIHISEPTRPY